MCDVRGVVDTLIPLPVWLLLDAARWEQIPLVVCQVVVLLLAVTLQKAVRITPIRRSAG